MTTDKVLEELLLEADKAAEPGDWKVNNVIHRPDEALPLPMVASALTSAGHVYIYDTLTRERSVTNRNMLLAQLRKLRADGTRVFTTVKPDRGPVRGILTCRLHSSRPERAHYDTMGFAVCPKSNLPSEFQVQQHMAHRHRVEWATIEQERTQAERDEERVFQRSLITLAAKGQPAPQKRGRQPGHPKGS